MELIRKARPTEPVGFRLPTSGAAKLRTYAANNGCTISDVVISALVAADVISRVDAVGELNADAQN